MVRVCFLASEMFSGRRRGAFVYWVAISAIGGAEIVGLTSATVALAGMVTSFLPLGEG